jgi:hypothetical protein
MVVEESLRELRRRRDIVEGAERRPEIELLEAPRRLREERGQLGGDRAQFAVRREFRDRYNGRRRSLLRTRSRRKASSGRRARASNDSIASSAREQAQGEGALIIARRDLVAQEHRELGPQAPADAEVCSNAGGADTRGLHEPSHIRPALARTSGRQREPARDLVPIRRRRSESGFL